MSRKAFSAEGAASIGPYSHAVESGEIIYLSGQTPIEDWSGKLVVGDIVAQTEQCFKNLFNVLKAAGLTPDSVEKVNVFLTNMSDFTAMNAVYSKQFSAPYPARTTIGVAALPLGAQVEIEMIARRVVETSRNITQRKITNEPDAIEYNGMDGLKEMKIGVIVRTTLREILENSEVSKQELEQMQTKKYSKEIFDIQFPLLQNARLTDGESPKRYYTSPVKIHGEYYFLCSEWYEVPANNDRPYLLKWLALKNSSHKTLTDAG